MLDLQQRVESGYYQENPFDFRTQRQEWRTRDLQRQAEFFSDAQAYLREQGVPQQYAERVVNYAWMRGHSEGYYVVFSCLVDLIDIFQV